MSRRVIPAAVLALLLPSFAWAGGTVAIPPLVPKGVDPKVSKNITGLLSSELDFSGAFDTVNELEAAPASLNATCLTQTTCLAAIAKGAGADSLVVGSVGPGPDGLQIFLVLYDAGKNTVVRKQTFNVAADPASLTENSGKWIKQLTTGQSPAAQAAATPSAASFEASDEEEEFEFDKAAKPKTRMDTSAKPRALEDDEEEAPAPKVSAKAKAEADARAKAEAKAEADAKAKAEAQAKAKAEAERKAREEEAARLAREEAAREAREEAERQAALEEERRLEAAKEAKIAAQRRAEDERRAREAEEERQAQAAAKAAAASKSSTASKSKPAPAEDDDLEFGSAAGNIELDFGSNASGITFDEGGDDEEEAPKPAPKSTASSKSTTSSKSTSTAKSSGSASRPTYEDDEDLDAPAPKKPASYEDDEDVLADEDEPAPRKSYEDLDEEEEPRSKSSSAASKSSSSKSGSSSSKSGSSSSKSSASKSSGSSSKSSASKSSGSSSKSKSSMRYEDLDKGSRTSSPGEKPGVSVAGRVGYSRYGNFNFVTYGAELGIPVASVVSLVVGIEGFSTQRHLSDPVVAKLAQEAGVSEDEIDPDPWNTILPINFGVVYKSNGETVKPYGGVDLTLTPYTADFDVAFGARARGGADFMVADNFGLNLNVAVGFMSGSKLEQTESGVNNSGLIPQVSAGTVFAF